MGSQRVLCICLLGLFTGCSLPPKARAPECQGETLFGRPIDKTGLKSDRCQPQCRCNGESWQAPDYAAADVQRALSWTLSEPPSPLAVDPYTQPAPTDDTDTDAVCAVVSQGGKRYRLKSYESEALARAQGAFPTHFGRCGVCSSLADLAVYMRFLDLSTPVRDCGLAHASAESHIPCLQALGFSYPCAQIWYYNTIATRQSCLAPCLLGFNDPYNLADGALNRCLTCDEQKSGPIFKQVAGRTRRNTGIANAICRPCTEVRRLVHDYL